MEQFPLWFSGGSVCLSLVVLLCFLSLCLGEAGIYRFVRDERPPPICHVSGFRIQPYLFVGLESLWLWGDAAETLRSRCRELGECLSSVLTVPRVRSTYSRVAI